jgi:hypothetical protein
MPYCLALRGFFDEVGVIKEVALDSIIVPDIPKSLLKQLLVRSFVNVLPSTNSIVYEKSGKVMRKLNCVW